MVTCNLRIDFLSGPVPGQLSAVVRLVSPAGELLAAEAPQVITVGKSLTVGPVQVRTGLPSQVGPTPPEPKGLLAGQPLPGQLAAGS